MADGSARRIRVPLYDFHCRACGSAFEALVRGGTTPICPSCQSPDLERQLSTFSVSSSERTRHAADAKRRKAAAIGAQDCAALDREGERHRKEDH
jgi:putative FmdB family regulatory protein